MMQSPVLGHSLVLSHRSVDSNRLDCEAGVIVQIKGPRWSVDLP